MKIELTLLENSLDFFKESLEQYIIADEHGTHHEYRSDCHKKIKWKMAFINLVQAMELLMKEIISSVSPALTDANIDSFSNGDKSISFTQCIVRLVKFSHIKVSEEEIGQLHSCAKLRNRFTHYDVFISSEEVKKKYSSLLSLYVQFYNKAFEKDIFIETINAEIISSILDFADKYTIFRGYEVLNSNIAQFKEDIYNAQQHTNFVDKNGKIVQRVIFGLEEDFRKGVEEGDNDSYYIPSIYLWDYCDDCGAKQGEYHLLHCDLERCPICNGQALTCDCELQWAPTI